MQTSNLSNISPLASDDEEAQKPKKHLRNRDLSNLWESELKPKILQKYTNNRLRPSLS